MTHYIFIDINGTIIPDDAVTFLPDPRDFGVFHKQVDHLRADDIRIGLCSDTPLEQLMGIAQSMDLPQPTPILAENGNLFYDGGDTIIRKRLSERVHDEILQRAQAIADECGYSRVADVVAPEFSDVVIDYSVLWGVGANRRTSISLFGPPDFIQRVGQEVSRAYLTNGQDVSVDISPEHNFLGIHPIDNFLYGKSVGMEWLWEHSENVSSGIDSLWMIGDSPSDLVGTAHPKMRSCFVATEKLSDQQRAEAFYISEQPLLAGVTDCVAVITHELAVTRRQGLSD